MLWQACYVKESGSGSKIFAGRDAMWRNVIISLAGWVSLTVASELVAAPPAGTPLAGTATSDTAPSSDALQQLVDQLGATSFARRKAAAATLVRVGAPAKAILRRRARDPSLEVRLAAESVLRRILQREFDERLQAFVADSRPIDGRWLPCWDEMQQLTGDRPAARQLYAQMLRSEGMLLLACARQEESFDEQVLQRVHTLQPFDVNGEYAARQLPVPTIATLLFVGKRTMSAAEQGGLSELITLLALKETVVAIESSSQTVVLRPLLEQFVLALADSQWTSGRLDSGRYYALDLALTYRLETPAAALARRILLWPNSPPRMLQHALLGLGRFGDSSDVDLLQPHLKNRMLCHTPSLLPDSEGAGLQVQVRDIALAVDIHLHRRQPRDFGFQRIARSRKTLFVPQSCGFVSSDSREAAFAAWQKEKSHR